jgi:hypothetical protein
MGAKTEVKVRSLFLFFYLFLLLFFVCVLVTPFSFFRISRLFLILLANDDGDERGMGFAISPRCEEGEG